MSIGAALAVMALGAILSFAVHGGPHGLDLHMVGFILLAVGAVGLYFRTRGFGPLRRVVVLPRRREITTTTTTTRGPVSPYRSAVAPAETGHGWYVRPDLSADPPAYEEPTTYDEPAIYTEQRTPTPDTPGEYVPSEPLSSGR
jgi:hypothetical protein